MAPLSYGCVQRFAIMSIIFGARSYHQKEKKKKPLLSTNRCCSPRRNQIRRIYSGSLAHRWAGSRSRIGSYLLYFSRYPSASGRKLSRSLLKDCFFFLTPDGAAARAGVVCGDRIIKVRDNLVSTWKAHVVSGCCRSSIDFAKQRC